MEESLVYYICKLPEEKDCSKFLNISKVAKGAFKTSPIGNILFGKVNEIKESAFENCKELKLVAWGKDDALNKTSQMLYYPNTNFIFGFDPITVSDADKIIIQQSAFKSCDKLETVILPNNPCIIEKDAFAQCRALRTVVLPSGDTEIAGDPFIGCNNLTIVCKKDDFKLQAYARAHSIRIVEID